jgi:hypothetical protein
MLQGREQTPEILITSIVLNGQIRARLAKLEGLREDDPSVRF